MSSVLNEQEITLLEKYPELVPITKRLREDSWVPKGKFDEALVKQQELTDALARVESDRQVHTAKVNELETQFKAEKAVADQYRQYHKERKLFLKEQFGDYWIPEYEGDTFSLSSLEKIAERVLHSKLPGTVTTPPGKQAAARRLSEMSPTERETAIAKAKIT